MREVTKEEFYKAIGDLDRPSHGALSSRVWEILDQHGVLAGRTVQEGVGHEITRYYLPDVRRKIEEVGE